MDSVPIHDPGPGGSDILDVPQKTRHDGEMPVTSHPSTGANMENAEIVKGKNSYFYLYFGGNQFEIDVILRHFNWISDKFEV